MKSAPPSAISANISASPSNSSTTPSIMAIGRALGKNVGDDFREGKITLPVITAYQAGDAEEKAFWKRCIEDGAIADGDLEHAIVLLGRHGALKRPSTRRSLTAPAPRPRSPPSPTRRSRRP